MAELTGAGYNRPPPDPQRIYKDFFMLILPFIPGRREAAGPESILQSSGVMDSGLAAFGRAPE
jgi:hypothetical protein